ncbi:MAG: TRAP transporter substrate-binding protein [Gemmatimonadetes bacterium]|nr:TRAP transporter substrate-binding protein [Gemmatimonadota bacterium]MYC00200.1 TRAP transporter substrate-binding protein [Gemmatimonadota bacterium]MYI45207.1 TRAP transporter substrate-binding protein [Gemmatimonadota bacterium]
MSQTAGGYGRATRRTAPAPHKRGPDPVSRCSKWARGLFHGLAARGEKCPGIRVAALPGWIAAALVAGCGGGTPADGPRELSFGHVGAPGSLFAITAEEFARRVNERLDGEAEVVVYGSSQLGGDDVLLQKLKLGTVDLALPSSIMSSRIAEFGLFEMPYLVRNRDHMARIEEEIVWPRLAPLAEEQGLRILAVWENGYRHVTNNVRPVRVPEDLDGIKLRTPRGTWRVKLFQQFGANPVPMAFSDVLLALRTGVVDGQENPLAQISAANLDEVQTYLSLTQHVYTPAYVTVSAEHWEDLPEDLRAVVEEEARGLRPFVYETAKRLDRELLVELGRTNISVNWASRNAFDDVSQLLYEQFATDVASGRELIDRALMLANN